MFLCSSGTRESFILLAVSILAFGRKQRQQSDREKWNSWANVPWVLFPFFHAQPSLLHSPPPPPAPPDSHTISAIIMSIAHCRSLSWKMLFKAPAELDGCPQGLHVLQRTFYVVGSNGTFCRISCVGRGSYCLFYLGDMWRNIRAWIRRFCYITYD